jgi:hypothetical protein
MKAGSNNVEKLFAEQRTFDDPTQSLIEDLLRQRAEAIETVGNRAREHSL